MSHRAERLTLVGAGLLLMAGTAVFLWGGSQHPQAGPNLGVVGSDAYWQAFAMAMDSHPSWGRVHAFILAGPLLWALGAAGVLVTVFRRGASFSASFGAIAMGIGASAWAGAFVFDGWIAPRYAHVVASATEPVLRSAAMLGFQSTQDLVVRLGLVSWLMLSAATAALAIGVAAARLWGSFTSWSLVATGFGLAAWSVGAWAAGEFLPGPFTSRFWTATAVLTAAWYLGLGAVTVLSSPLRGDASAA